MRMLMVVFFLAFGLLQYRLWFAEDGIVHTCHLKKEIQARQKQNQAIEKYNMELTEEIAKLKQGGKAIEGRARNELGMIKKDEIFYQIVSKDSELEDY